MVALNQKFLEKEVQNLMDFLAGVFKVFVQRTYWKQQWIYFASKNLDIYVLCT